MKKSILCIPIALTLALTLFSSMTYAYDAFYFNYSDGQSFEDAWELTDSGRNWEMTYGYNTSWINEDYTHTYNSQEDHYAGISNANGFFSDSDNAGQWAGIEVTHSGTDIAYSIGF